MNDITIIAEAGVNHNGSLRIAKKMVDVAASADADFIKFQIYTATKVLTRNAPKAPYQLVTTSQQESQLEMAQKLELSHESFKELSEYCREKNINFLATPFDLDSVNFLDHLNVDTLKVPSGEITNLPLLERIGKLNKKLIVSTGMCDIQEISNALDLLLSCGSQKENITVLHCNTDYPTVMEDVNLSAMLTIREKLDVDVGYSDHTLGITIPIAAVAMGAKVIEKHFTLDKSMEGPDHKASLDPGELRDMVVAIREIERAIGAGEKKASPSEEKNRSIVRRSIVAAKEIKKGEAFTENNLTTKRPGTGLNPMLWYRVIGKIAHRDFTEDSFIEVESVAP